MNYELTSTNVSGIERHSVGPIESVFAEVAVDAPGVMLAIEADSTALVVAVDVEGGPVAVDFRVVHAVVRMPETVAS